ncbi:POK10 protein, partial [Aegotheles bennettii]|nr:POK10 protein [Aegotheles bennettii]
LAIENNRADRLVAAVWSDPRTDLFLQARASHEFFHQGAKVLKHQFHNPLSDAQGIINSCPACQKQGVSLRAGVDPRGLQALQLWQMDVTHIPESGQSKNVHVSIDTLWQYGL